MSRSLLEASKIAERFVELVADCCDRIVVAGSIRRKKAEIRDIDIVAISKVVTVEKPAFFGPIKTTESLLHSRIESLVKNGIASVRVKIDGKTMVGASVAFIEFEQMPVDVYYCKETQWWGLVQMRTGSAGFNRMLATRALSMGLKYHGSGDGITRQGVRVDDGMSEESIFTALGLKYLPPEQRD